MSSRKEPLSIDSSHLPQDSSRFAIKLFLKHARIALSNRIVWADDGTKTRIHERCISNLPVDISLVQEQVQEIVEATYWTVRAEFSAQDADVTDVALNTAKEECLSSKDSIAAFTWSLLWGVGPVVNHSLIRAKEAEEKAFQSRLGDVSDEALES